MAGFSGAVKLGDLDDFIAPSQSCVVALNGAPRARSLARSFARSPRASRRPRSRRSFARSRPPPHSPAATPSPRPPPVPHRAGDKLDLGAAELDVPEGGEVLLRKRGVAPRDGAPRDGAPSAPSAPGISIPFIPPPPPPSSSSSGPVKVTLSDCLACSGCVTSAETVLLEAQSGAEFVARARRARSAPDEACVVSVSPQSVVSLARAANLAPPVAAARLAGFFKSVHGAVAVFDVSESRELALAETCDEFVRRFRADRENRARGGKGGGSLPALASACPGWVCYAEKQHGDVLKHISAVKSPMAVMGAAVKTRVASALGLAPKGVFHAAVMPCFDKKLEAAREDLAIAGEGIPDVDCVLTTGEVAEMLAKERRVAVAGGVEADAGTDASDFDARRGAALLALEGFPVASFDSPFTDDAFGANAPTTNVNAAVNDGEEDPVAVGGGDVEMAESDANPAASASDFSEAGGRVLSGSSWRSGRAFPHGGGGSGGYLDATFRHAAKALFGLDVRGPLEYRRANSRNRDLREVTLEGPNPGPDGRPEVLLRFAAAYGFKNIQNVVRKCRGGNGGGGVMHPAERVGDGSLSRGYYDFVEIMACPGGCLNGGGQIPPPPRYAPGTRLSADAPLPDTLGGVGAREMLDELELAYARGEWGSPGGEGGGEEGRCDSDSSGGRGLSSGERQRASTLAAAYGGWIGDGVGSERARAALHTVYHDRGAEAAGRGEGERAAAARLKASGDW